MMNDATQPIAESYWVLPGRFLAGEYPAAFENEQTLYRLRSLLGAGLDIFVDLTEAGELPPYDSDLSSGGSRGGARLHLSSFPYP